MTTYKELQYQYSQQSQQQSPYQYTIGRIIADTRPNRADIYLDGEIVLDSSGQIAKTPTVIHNVIEGYHTVTFSKSGYNDITIVTNVVKDSDCHARALLNTSMMAYPMMLSSQSLQPSPGWPYLPIKQVTYGHMVANTNPDGAYIYLDGQPVKDIVGNIATTPSSVIGIITGVHTVTFKKSGYNDTDVIIDIQNGLYSNAYAILQPIIWTIYTTWQDVTMLTLDEYKKLWITKDLELIKRSGMDKDERESIDNPCKWTATILERIGDAIQTEGLRIKEEDQYSLSIIMRSAVNDCRKCK